MRNSVLRLLVVGLSALSALSACSRGCGAPPPAEVPAGSGQAIEVEPLPLPGSGAEPPAYVQVDAEASLRGLSDEALQAECHERTNARACRVFGDRLRESPKRQPLLAIQAYQRACDGRVLGACVEMAKMYAAGEGVPKSEAISESLWTRTEGDAEVLCLQTGVGEACGVLGDVRARRGAQDGAQAAWAMACEKGWKPACEKVTGQAGDGSGGSGSGR